MDCGSKIVRRIAWCICAWRPFRAFALLAHIPLSTPSRLRTDPSGCGLAGAADGPPGSPQSACVMVDAQGLEPRCLSGHRFTVCCGNQLRPASKLTPRQPVFAESLELRFSEVSAAIVPQPCGFSKHLFFALLLSSAQITLYCPRGQPPSDPRWHGRNLAKTGPTFFVASHIARYEQTKNNRVKGPHFPRDSGAHALICPRRR